MTVVRFTDCHLRCRPRTRGGTRARAGCPSETSRTSDLDRGGDSEGDSSGEGLNSADGPREGGVLATRVSFAASASRRRCSEDASARRSGRQTRLLGFVSFLPRLPRQPKRSFLGPMKKAFELRTNCINLSAGVTCTCHPEILEIESLFAQGSRTGRTLGEGRSVEFPKWTVLIGIGRTGFDTRPDAEFDRNYLLPQILREQARGFSSKIPV